MSIFTLVFVFLFCMHHINTSLQQHSVHRLLVFTNLPPNLMSSEKSSTTTATSTKREGKY